MAKYKISYTQKASTEVDESEYELAEGMTDEQKIESIKEIETDQACYVEVTELPDFDMQVEVIKLD